MIRALGLLQRLERSRMLALPVEPALEPLDRGRLAGAGAFHTEQIAGLLVVGTSNPLTVAFGGDDAIAHNPNRAGLTAVSAKSNFRSSSASATSCAVNGARSTPLR